MTFSQLAMAAMPGVSADVAEYALWNKTAFPMEVEPRRLYKSLNGYYRASKHGIQLCEWCHRPAVDGWNCEVCNSMLAD